jgi:hypothetical protein
VPRETFFKIVGYKDISDIEEQWGAARKYDAFEAEKFNKSMLSALNTIDADLAPPDDIYVCPFCDKISVRYLKKEGEVFLRCSACGSSVTLNDEVWENPRRRIEFLSLTSGYPGAYILHHFLALHGNNRDKPVIPDSESREIEKSIRSLSSPDEEIRYRAARYLRLRRPPQAFTPVVTALGSEQVTKIRVMLVNALPSIGGRSAIPYLITATEDVDPAVRKAALQALSSFGETVVDKETGRVTLVR